MKKFISNIIAIIMIITTINIPLATAESNINYPRKVISADIYFH